MKKLPSWGELLLVTVISAYLTAFARGKLSILLESHFLEWLSERGQTWRTGGRASVPAKPRGLRPVLGCGRVALTT